MSASLLQSVPGRHRDSDVAPTGKERFPRQETAPHPGNPVNLVNPDSDRRDMGGHTSLPTTSVGAVANRAYRLVTVGPGPVPRRAPVLAANVRGLWVADVSRFVGELAGDRPPRYVPSNVFRVGQGRVPRHALGPLGP